MMGLLDPRGAMSRGGSIGNSAVQQSSNLLDWVLGAIVTVVVLAAIMAVVLS